MDATFSSAGLLTCLSSVHLHPMQGQGVMGGPLMVVVSDWDNGADLWHCWRLQLQTSGYGGYGAAGGGYQGGAGGRGGAGGYQGGAGGAGGRGGY